MEYWPYLIAALGIAGGGFLKGATGVGAPVVGVPILAMVFDLPKAVAIFSVINLLSNIWQSWAYRKDATDLRFVWMFAAAGGAGAMVGSVLLALLPTEVLMATLAGVVAAYIILRLARPHWQLPRETARRIGPSVGFFGGLMQGAGGISAPVSVTFLNAMRLGRAEFIGTISVFFLSMSAFQIPVLVGFGILTLERAGLAILSLAPLFAGVAVGAWAARRLSKEAFDKVILVLLAVIAVKLLWDAVL
ncbi:sulfite exporter TauE/SafE family protein [Silicimonas sp. MF1-12-2]|jgi:uncharacterized membrane protein YfcA|uniref:sulfite exporter TauE/SafE family protein n=1 Tax=Silicimonas sp. MF1-12-2 TaxID=3384793 RepID=UPI0039B3A5F8